jgi:hypothetical protein
MNRFSFQTISGTGGIRCDNTERAFARGVFGMRNLGPFPLRVHVPSDSGRPDRRGAPAQRGEPVMHSLRDFQRIVEIAALAGPAGAPGRRQRRARVQFSGNISPQIRKARLGLRAREESDVRSTRAVSGISRCCRRRDLAARH